MVRFDLYRHMRPYCALAITIAFLVSCSGIGHERFEAGPSTYMFPADTVASVQREPHRFVRVRPPDATFDLVWDSRLEGRTDARGLPAVFRMSEAPATLLGYVQTPAGIAGCRPGIAPAVRECGLSLPHGGTRWSLLLPESRLGEAAAMAAHAERFLSEHRM